MSIPTFTGECPEAYTFRILSSESTAFTSGDVHHYISEQLAHLLSNAIEGYNCHRQTVSDMVVKTSVTGAAIEGTCNAFADAPPGMTVRSYLSEELSVKDLQEIECKMQTMLKVDLPKRL